MIYEYTVTPSKRLRCGNIVGRWRCVYSASSTGSILFKKKNSKQPVHDPTSKSISSPNAVILFPRLSVYSKSPMRSCRLCSIHGLCNSSIFDMQQRQIFWPEACSTKEKKKKKVVANRDQPGLYSAGRRGGHASTKEKPCIPVMYNDFASLIDANETACLARVVAAGGRLRAWCAADDVVA